MTARPDEFERPASTEPSHGSPALERLLDVEVLNWYRLTPQQRWLESMRLWETFLDAWRIA